MAYPQPVNDTAPPIGVQSLPHNVEAEAALLGALMIDNRIAEDVQLKLRPEHFFEPLHGRIFEQILRLLDRNMIASRPSSTRKVTRNGPSCPATSK